MGHGEVNVEAIADARVEAPPLAADGKSWGRLGLTFAGLVLLTAATTLLVQYFQTRRPLDLRELTGRLAHSFEQSLQMHYVPAEAIVAEAPQFQSFEDGGGWNYHEYRVTLPPDQDMAALTQILRQDLATRGVGVHLERGGTGEGRLRLTLQGETFLSALLAQPPPSRKKLDLRAASTRIANDVAETLQVAGAEVLLAQGPEDQEDENSLWTISRLSARFSSMPDRDALRQALEEPLAPRQASVMLSEGVPGTLRLDIVFRDKTVAEVTVHSETVALPAPDAAMPEAPPAEAPAPPPPAPLITEAPLPAPSPADQPQPAGTPQDAVENQPHTHPDHIAPPVAPLEESAEATAPPVSTAIAEPELPPQEELPLESTVIEEAQLERQENGLDHIAQAASPAALKKPRIALIIDDGGYGGERTERLLELDPRLTLAILPNTPFALETARRAAEKGFELMLHMPMETYGGPAAAFPGEIRTNMEAEEIRQLTLDAIAQIPGIKGINNHTGSKYTRDGDKMAEFLKVVQEQNMFFIDSITITRSTAYAVAQSMDIPSARRDIFIDNSSSPALIRERFRELILRAKTRGTAIGIGHFRPNTVRVLEEELPKLEEYGVDLVHASELVH